MNNTTASGGEVKPKPLRYEAELAIRNSDLKFPTRHLLNVMWQLADWYTGHLEDTGYGKLILATGMKRDAIANHLTLAEEAGFLKRSSNSTPMKHEKNSYVLFIPTSRPNRLVAETDEGSRSNRLGVVAKTDAASIRVNKNNEEDLVSERHQNIRQEEELTCLHCGEPDDKLKMRMWTHGKYIHRGSCWNDYNPNTRK